MNIIVGTQNKGKIEAVKQGLANYSYYAKAKIKGVNVNSGVKEQPIVWKK